MLEADGPALRVAHLVGSAEHPRHPGVLRARVCLAVKASIIPAHAQAHTLKHLINLLNVSIINGNAIYSGAEVVLQQHAHEMIRQLRRGHEEWLGWRSRRLSRISNTRINLRIVLVRLR